MRITNVEVLFDHSVRLRFDDGIEKEVDLDPFLHGPDFAEIRSDPAAFAAVTIDPAAGTIVWPNGADVAPDILYEGGRTARMEAEDTAVHAAFDIGQLRHLLATEDRAAYEALNSLRDFEMDEWVTAFRATRHELRIACLIREEGVEEALRHASFTFNSDDGRPGLAGSGDGKGGWDVEYLTVGAEVIVPLVIHRYFEGPFPNVVELAEDFRLFWDLYEDRESGHFLTTDEVGDRVVVAEVDLETSEVRIRKNYLRRYQAVRQLHLCLQVAVDRHGAAELEHLTSTNIDVSEAGFRVAYHGGTGLSDDAPNFTRILAKRLIAPPPIERSGVWPYEAAPTFENFIIGLDSDGEPICHPADPDKLANHFGKNPESPQYLTPVFFSRTVLDKYYADPDRYEVGDAYLRASGSWGLRMDNALTDHVAVFLGDLGTKLPYREQQYWRPFNIPPLEGISETAFQRSFLGQFVDSERVEERFKVAYADLNDRWDRRFGWLLFKPLHPGDRHVLQTLHVPTNSSVGQFDDQIVRLTKLVVDSLNEKSIRSATTNPPGQGAKGISKLEAFLQENDLPAEPLCAELRAIQGARTRSAAHRKKEDFDIAVLLDGAPSLPARVERMLNTLIAEFNALSRDL